MIGLSEGAEPGAAHAGLDWREHVEIDPRYFRPAEVEALCADASKARRRLGWEPAVTFHELVGNMVDSDLEETARQMRGGTEALRIPVDAAERNA